MTHNVIFLFQHHDQVNSSEENNSNCCIIQYIIYPPHQKLLTKQQEDSTDKDGMLQEYSTDYQMVMEIWVEPQMGTIDLVDSPLSYIHGLEYNKIPEKVYLYLTKHLTVLFEKNNL